MEEEDFIETRYDVQYRRLAEELDTLCDQMTDVIKERLALEDLVTTKPDDEDVADQLVRKRNQEYKLQQEVDNLNEAYENFWDNLGDMEPLDIN